MLQGVPGLGQMDWGRVVRKEGKGPGGEGGGEGPCVQAVALSEGVFRDSVSGICVCGHRCRCAFVMVSHNPLSSQCNRENVKNTSS